MEYWMRNIRIRQQQEHSKLPFSCPISSLLCLLIVFDVCAVFCLLLQCCMISALEITFQFPVPSSRYCWQYLQNQLQHNIIVHNTIFNKLGIFIRFLLSPLLNWKLKSNMAEIMFKWELVSILPVLFRIFKTLAAKIENDKRHNIIIRIF